MKFSLFAIALASALNASMGNTILHEQKAAAACSETRFGCPATSSSESASASVSNGNSLDAALSLRGGEVQEPTTLQEVDDIIMKASAQGKLVVIDFSATWCGPCKMIAPLFKELSDMTELSNVVFLKIDVDENPETAAKYSVSAMPTFLFIKRGEVVDKLMGANPGKLEELLIENA
mmetsp:Transcript_6597/g.6265  ORF Transcript_6597/g.6265 Transcript_6597/m.6265 type:complete len:177 (-) Transcript_6597:161-691(-)